MAHVHTCVVREVHSVDNLQKSHFDVNDFSSVHPKIAYIDIVSQALQRKHCCLATDVAKGNMRLDAENAAFGHVASVEHFGRGPDARESEIQI